MAYAPKSFIYGLTDPRTGGVRYVGRTVSGMRRPKMHGFPTILAKDHTYKANWIRELRAAGLDYGIIILAEAEKEKLGEVEMEIIERAKKEGWLLTNLTGGGEGGHLGRKFSAEHRAKISAANKGRKMSEEQRRKLSEVAKNRPLDLVRVASMRAAWMGQKHSEETKKRIAESTRRTKSRLTA
jgi:hypothetical protein